MKLPRKARRHLPQRIPGVVAVLYEKLVATSLAPFYGNVAAEITASLASGRILDVGTGPGYLLVQIAQRNPHLTLLGLDLSRRMLKIAASTTTRRGAYTKVTTADEALQVLGPAAEGGTHLVRGDVQNLPFRCGVFDRVVSTLSLHHWRDPVKAIQECVRVTAPGGECWIYDLRSDVPARQYADCVTGDGLAALMLQRIFKFHGVDPTDYDAETVTQWLGGGGTVQAEVCSAYLKLRIRVAPCRTRAAI